MPAQEHLTLSRATYSLKDVAQLAGLEMDVLLERHVREGDFDLYLKVPAGHSVYSLIRNYLGLQPPSIVLYPHLVTPRKQAEIEAVRLSHRDCIALARFRRIEQYCFPAGLAVRSGESSHLCEQNEFEEVLLRDWNFYPGQFEASDYQFGYGAQLSEQSLDAIRKGVTFRLSPDRVEGGGPSDFCLLGRGGGRLRQSYEYWFGIYPNPPAPAPVAERSTGISVPSTMSISEADVFVTRENAKRFLEKFAKPIGEVDVEIDSQRLIIDKLEGLFEKHDGLLETLGTIAVRHEEVVERGESAFQRYASLSDNIESLAGRHEALVQGGERALKGHEEVVVALDGVARKHEAIVTVGEATIAKQADLAGRLESHVEKLKVNVVGGVDVVGVPDVKDRESLMAEMGLPAHLHGYSFLECLQKSELGFFRAVPSDDAPKMLKILFEIREAKWAVNWNKTLSRGFQEADDINEAVVSLIDAEAKQAGIVLGEEDAREISYFVRPVWARHEEDPEYRDKWSKTYETPEFMRLVSAARSLQEEREDRASNHSNDQIDAILRTADPVRIAGKKRKFARMIVRYAPGQPGRPSAVPPKGKSK